MAPARPARAPRTQKSFGLRQPQRKQYRQRLESRPELQATRAGRARPLEKAKAPAGGRSPAAALPVVPATREKIPAPSLPGARKPGGAPHGRERGFLMRLNVGDPQQQQPHRAARIRAAAYCTSVPGREPGRSRSRSGPRANRTAPRLPEASAGDCNRLLGKARVTKSPAVSCVTQTAARARNGRRKMPAAAAAARSPLDPGAGRPGRLRPRRRCGPRVALAEAGGIPSGRTLGRRREAA